MLDNKKFHFLLLPGKANAEVDLDLYNRVFDLWNQTWTDAYLKYWNHTEVYADQFTRQKLHLVLYYQNQIVGTVAFDVKDTALLATRRDSVFRMWDQFSYDKLKLASNHSQVLVCSWFTLSKEWRGSTQGIDTKKLLASVALKYFLKTGHQIMCSTPVHVGGFNQVCYDHSARCIRENASEKGLPVDFIYWKRGELIANGFPYYNDILQVLFPHEGVRKFA